MCNVSSLLLCLNQYNEFGICSESKIWPVRGSSSGPHVCLLLQSHLNHCCRREHAASSGNGAHCVVCDMYTHFSFGFNADYMTGWFVENARKIVLKKHRMCGQIILIEHNMLPLSAALDYFRGAWCAYARIALSGFGFGFANERPHVRANRHQHFPRAVTLQHKIAS